MNCIELFLQQAQAQPDALALWHEGAGSISFRELRERSASAQRHLREAGVRSGDALLVFDLPGPRLYALLIGALAMGASVVFVEPWMPLAKVRRAIELTRPKLFVANGLGLLWGLRSPAIRAIPRWARAGSVVRKTGAAELALESMPPDAPGILTFTSGTTGTPKGVVRRQAYLVEQHRVLERALHLNALRGADLCVFGNFALANLASGRGSILVPSNWSPSFLRKLDQFPDALKPESLTCGPGFLLALMRQARLPRLRSLHVGGALTDRWIFEETFRLWPQSDIAHIYGSTEAEPVSVDDAREAVRASEAAGYFQTLRLGQPPQEIRAELARDTIWVTGPHVCPEYLGAEDENRENKRRGPRGEIWHRMGDRVESRDGFWWYAGRSAQSPEDFALEQAVYAEIQSSAAMVHRAPDGQLLLAGQNLAPRKAELLRKFPQIERVLEAPIQRDPRHRARIDRAQTLKGIKL